MSSRADRGFTILEAVVALAIVGFAAVAAVEAVGSEMRTIDRAGFAYTNAALAQDRVAAVTLLEVSQLNLLPDSMARGEFAAPFDAFHWTTKVSPTFGQHDLYDVTIAITSDRSDYTVLTRLYRPQRVESGL